MLEGLAWRQSESLLLLLGLPLFYRMARRGGGVLRFSSLRPLRDLPAGWRLRLGFLPALLLSLCATALVVALAGPRLGAAGSQVRRQGIAIMTAVDLSSSMQALDLAGPGLEEHRLEVIKRIFAAFVKGDQGLAGRPDDLIGLVTFAGFADSRCPLTLDHGSLLAILGGLELVTVREEDGTAIGEGLALAVEQLRRSPARSRIIILLTDGVNNRGDWDPLAAAEAARALGLRIYTVGVGSRGLAPVPQLNPFTGRRQLVRMPVDIDEETLQKIAEKTDGRYFRATDAGTLQEIYRSIDQFERSEIVETRYLSYREGYPPLLAAAGAFLLLGLLLRAGPLGTWP